MKRLITAILILIIALISIGCKSSHEVIRATQYTAKTDTLWRYKTLLRLDSVYLHDSIFTAVRGDSVFVDRWHTKYINHNEIRTDTVYQAKTDTVQAFRDRIKTEKVREFSWRTFGLGFGLSVLLMVIFWIIKLMRKGGV
jgi:hypothetical protein